MRSYFGEIEQGKMIKNQIGKTAGKYWIEIPEYFLNFTTDEFIIMPNHIHGILIIENNLNYDSNDTFNKFQKIRKKSLSTAINQYKGAVTRYCKNKKLNFSWHSGFYEHIIRNENSLQKIKEYIVNNPAKWELDEYYRKQKKQL